MGIRYYKLSTDFQEYLDHMWKDLFRVKYNNDTTCAVYYAFEELKICTIEMKHMLSIYQMFRSCEYTLSTTAEYSSKIKHSLNKMNHALNDSTSLQITYDTGSNRFIFSKNILETIDADIASPIFELIVNNTDLCIKIIENGFNLTTVKGFVAYNNSVYAVKTPGWGEVLSSRLYRVLNCETFTELGSDNKDLDNIIAKYTMLKE